MPKTRRALAFVLALVLICAGCAPIAGIEYDDEATAPPAASAAPLALEAHHVEGVPDGQGALVAVAANELGVVAIGSTEHLGAGEALMLFSADGLRWERVGVVSGFNLTDIAAGSDGFVAVGTHTGAAGEELAALVVSRDGRSWETLPAEAHDAPEAYLEWIVAGPSGYRAGGSLMGDEGGAVSWWSIDGLRWQADETAVAWAAAAGPAWLEARDVMLRIAPGEAGTADTTWSLVEEPPGEATVIQLSDGAMGGEAMLVTGSVGKPCGLLGSCAAEQASWVSTDGTTWRLLPPGLPGAPPPYVDELAVGHRGVLVALGYAALSASMDGWHWSSIAEAEANVAWSDVAALDDGYVVVGTSGDAPSPLIEILRPAAP